MKIDVQELKRALAYAEKSGKLTEMNVEIDIHNRMVLQYTEPMGEDSVTIKIYDASTEKMADVTITSRLSSVLK